MKNDQGKGIFLTNLHAPLSKRRQASSANIKHNLEELEAQAIAAASAQVNSAQIDLNHLLNPYSAHSCEMTNSSPASFISWI